MTDARTPATVATDRARPREVSRATLAPAPGRAVVIRNHPIKLGTADEVRLEMARVYRDMKAGKIEAQDGTRLVYVLGEIRKAIETTVIERRLASLEGGGDVVAVEAD